MYRKIPSSTNLLNYPCNMQLASCYPVYMDFCLIYGGVFSDGSTNFDQAVCALVAQLDAPSNWRPGGPGFNPFRGWQHSFAEIDHEIFSTVILSLLLIQEGQLSVSGKRMCTILVNHLEDEACPLNMWLNKLTVLDVTPLG